MEILIKIIGKILTQIRGPQYKIITCEDNYNPECMNHVPKLTDYFSIGGQIGAGKFSKVYGGRSKKFGELDEVAIKIANKNYELWENNRSLYMQAKGMERLVNEMSKNKRDKEILCEYFGLYKVYNQGLGIEQLCIVMEKKRCDSLKVYDGKITYTMLREIIIDCCKGLSYFESLGVLHGDIHTGNILFDGERAYLIDGAFLDPVELATIGNVSFAYTDYEIYHSHIQIGIDALDMIKTKDIFELGSSMLEIFFNIKRSRKHERIAKKIQEILYMCTDIDPMMRPSLSYIIKELEEC